MARSYAKILVTAWGDDEWVALDPTAKLVYLFLLSQPKMRSCGVIDLQETRWAPRIGIDATELHRLLDKLERLDYIARDTNTGELAVRTFVKHDAGNTMNSKVWCGIWSSLGQVESPMLRQYVAASMPDQAFEPKAKPSLTERPPMPDRSPIDDQSIPHRQIPDRSPIDARSITSGKSFSTSESVNPKPPSEASRARSRTIRQRVSAVVEAWAHDEFETALESQLIDDEAAYLATIRRRIDGEHGQRIDAAATANLDASTAELLALVRGDYTLGVA